LSSDEQGVTPLLIYIYPLEFNEFRLHARSIPLIISGELLN